MFWNKNKAPLEQEPTKEAGDPLMLEGTRLTYTLFDYPISAKLTDMYLNIDLSLEKIFKNGELDSANGNMWDNEISARSVLAQNELNSEYHIRTEFINGMQAWRARDEERLDMQIAMLEARLLQNEEKLDSLKERERLLTNRKNGGKENG